MMENYRTQLCWNMFMSNPEISPMLEAVGFKTSMNDFNKSHIHKFQLYQNYPNPFNPATTIEYDLAKSGHTQLDIYNLTGRLVKTVANINQPAGHYQVTWDGTDEHNQSVAAGIYFCRLKTGTPSLKSGQGFVKVIKLALVR